MTGQVGGRRIRRDEAPPHPPLSAARTLTWPTASEACIFLGVKEPDIEAALQKSFLGRLPRDLVDRLVEGQLRMDVPADTTIYREGEASRAFLVISGLFRLFLAPVTAAGHDPVRQAFGGPGTALVVGGPLDVRAGTLAPSTILGIDVGRLEEAARRDAAVAYALSRELSRRLDETLQQMAKRLRSVKQRVASQLLELATTEDRSNARLSAHLSQQGLADAVEWCARSSRGGCGISVRGGSSPRRLMGS